MSGIAWTAAHAQAVQSPHAGQAASDGQIHEVVVTAQRMPSDESRTPVAMSAIAGERLREAGIDRPSDLSARLPNVHLDGAADGLKITIRGVSNADTTEKGDPSAAFLIDGIYIARPQSQNLPFHDIARVEVLRGPQGTLYGRNATAGVVNVISNAPVRKLEGAASVGAGNHGSRKGSAMLNVPVSAALALRAAVAYNKHDSYLDNAQGTPHALGLDRDDRSARVSARLALGRSASLLLRHDRSTIGDNNDSFVPDTNFYLGVASGKPQWYGASTGQRLTNAFVPPNTVPQQGFSDKTTSGTAVDLSWDLGPVSLSYLGSHRDYQHDALANFYYRVAPAFALGVRQAFSGDYEQDSHELRVATNGSGPLTAQAGLYYFSEESNSRYSFRDLELVGLPPFYVFPTGPTLSRSRAVFGQATYSLTPQLRATVGARYTEDDKSRVGSTNFQQTPVFNPATDLRMLNAASLATHKTTWRLGAEYDVAPSTFVYGAMSTGYKAGGFNEGCLAGSSGMGMACPAALAVPAETLLYQPEQLRAYEAGLKTRFWHKRASLNVTAFDYDYTNLQLSGVAIVRGAPRYVTNNAGSASVKGLEVEGVVRATSSGSFNYALALLDAHYVSYMPDGVHSWAGEKLDRAPSRVVTLGYEHRFRAAGGELKAGLSARSASAYTIAVPSQLLQYPIPARTTADASLAFRPDRARWSVHALVKNIGDKVAPIAIDSFGMLVPSDPRTVDVRLDYRF
ncbi:TonB-dependent receptor [Massilia sp. GCM10020059]|uniref:TonB-dependent receptor n=1 Tax=Massilia agrisoli TaxID=2892444 RepID=A0ABS8ISQ3_9BURK|nr:TonB-dependent receptor [Massilia agrisoli]MCC6070916.1 TonB-dependent receptor [Massilia agrisoli]